MYNTRPQAPWVPFTIPATPSVTGKSWGGELNANDPYILSPKSGAEPSKNPSQYLEWNQIPINHILEKIEKVEELNAKVEELNAKVEELNAKVEELNAKVEQFDGRITSVEGDINAINSRLNSASINAVCQNGNVTVTLNL